MAKEKACKKCKTVFEGKGKCPKCGSDDLNDRFKGKVVILDTEKSEIAKNLDIKEKGSYAIKA